MIILNQRARTSLRLFSSSPSLHDPISWVPSWPGRCHAAAGRLLFAHVRIRGHRLPKEARSVHFSPHTSSVIPPTGRFPTLSLEVPIYCAYNNGKISSSQYAYAVDLLKCPGSSCVGLRRRCSGGRLRRFYHDGFEAGSSRTTKRLLIYECPTSKQVMRLSPHEFTVSAPGRDVD